MNKSDLLKYLQEIIAEQPQQEDEITVSEFATAQQLSIDVARKKLEKLVTQGVLVSRVVYSPTKTRLYKKNE